MEEYIAKIDLEYNGRIIDVYSVKPNARQIRARAATMTKNGTVRTRPEWGLQVVVQENENSAKNVNFSKISGATITIIYDSGRRRIYPNCDVLSVDENGYNGSSPNQITFDVACDEPMEA